ncbi:MAG: 7TM diverse intracellular signaling domain-containing protein [Sediminibacterium sp.]
MHGSIKLYYFFLSIILFLASFRTDAQEQAPSFYLYEDGAKQLTPDSALHLFKMGKFTRAVKTEHNVGFTRSIFWLAYENPVNRHPDSLLLFIGHHHINRIFFYFISDSIPVEQWVTGDYYPFSQKPVDATGFYFPVTQKGTYLARIDKSNESLQLSFGLYSKTEALSVEANDKTIVALFTGMILLLVIFGAYLFIIGKDRLYLYYILFISTGWLWVLSNAGYGFQYLWPELPWFASRARPVFSIAPMIFSALFLIRYIGVNQNKRIRLLIRIMNTMLLCCIGLILLISEEGYQSNAWLYLQYFIPVNPLLYILITLVILIRSALKGNRLAVFYLAANGVLLLTALMQVLFSMGGIKVFDRFFSHYGLALGYVTEAIIITAGLVYRFNRYRLDRESLLVEMNRRQQENTRILIAVQEAERSHVANQLHDVAGSLLSAAKLNLSSLREKGWNTNSNKAVLQLEKTEDAVGLVSDMVRNLSHALSPVMLTQVGFKTSLEKIVSIFNASGKINIRLIVIGFEEYLPERNNYYTALYSIVYELLNNIVKHSQAAHALIQVIEHTDLYTIVAEDDGVGIDDDVEGKKPRLGITGIESKINYFNGSFALDKNEANGLIVTIEIPISNDPEQNSIGR